MSLYEFDEEAFVKDIQKTAFEDGFEDGLAQGKVEGRAEGKTAGKAEDIMELLQEKASIPEEMKSQILAQTDLTVLSKWLKAAAKADGLEEWKRMLQM